MTKEAKEKPNKITIAVVVNGAEVTVEVNVNSPLKSIMKKALKETGNIGQADDKWELKDKEGNILDIDKKIKDYDLDKITPLFLSLKAGAAGE